LKAIQLLWINLLMDSLASLALSTEGPSEELLTRKPYGRTKPLLSPIMIRNILGHAVYQLAVLFYFIFGIDKNLGIACGRPECRAAAVHECAFFDQDCHCSHSKEPTEHYTMVFNVFVMMTLFNEVNARKLNGERNVFHGILLNKIFWYVIVATIFGQVILVEFGSLSFGTTHLSWDKWLICVAFGAGGLLWHQVVLKIPPHWFPSGEKTMASPSPADLEMAQIPNRELKKSLSRSNSVNVNATQLMRTTLGGEETSPEMIQGPGML